MAVGELLPRSKIMNNWSQKWYYRNTGCVFLFTLALVVSVVCWAQPAAAQMMGQQRGMQQQMGVAGQQQPPSPVQIAQGNIHDMAQTIITDFFLTGTPLDAEAVNMINLDLDEVIRPHAGRFNDESKSYLLMVESLLAYYQGNHALALEKAHLAIEEVKNNSILNQNPVQLYITLSMSYGEYDEAKNLLTQIKSGAAVDPVRAATLAAQATGMPTQAVRPAVRNPQTAAANRGGQTEPPARTTSRWLTNMGVVNQTVQGAANRNMGINQRMGGMGGMNPGMTGGMGGTGQQTTETFIGLPMDYLRYENIGDDFSTVSFRSINGSYIRFEPEKGQLLCALLWTLPEIQAGANPNLPAVRPNMQINPNLAMGTGMGTGMGMGATQTEDVPQPTIQPVAYDFNTNSTQFKELFQWHQNAVIEGKIQFIGLNLDYIDDYNRAEVAKTTFTNAWPWATCLIHDPLNQDQWEQTQTPGSALMMIVDTNGKIRYVGPVGGIIPKMILDNETMIAQPAIPQALPDLADTSIARAAKAAAEAYTGPTEPVIVHGTLAGREFSYENASLKNEVLRISQGQGLYADLELEIYLFLRGDSPANKTYTITPQDVNNIPYINLKWMPAGAFIPRTEKFTSNYEMNLEFGAIIDGKLTGKINLQLPDVQKSQVKGEFVVTVQ